MAIDPVCMMQVEPANVTVKAWYRGEVYYFCLARCEKAFAADPQKYASVAPTDSPGHVPPRPGPR